MEFGFNIGFNPNPNIGLTPSERKSCQDFSNKLDIDVRAILKAHREQGSVRLAKTAQSVQADRNSFEGRRVEAVQDDSQSSWLYSAITYAASWLVS